MGKTAGITVGFPKPQTDIQTCGRALRIQWLLGIGQRAVAIMPDKTVRDTCFIQLDNPQPVVWKSGRRRSPKALMPSLAAAVQALSPKAA